MEGLAQTSQRRKWARAASASAVAALLFLAGCSASSPRFTSPASGQAFPQEEEVRFAARIRDEETRGDDRKVNVAEVKNRLTTPSRNLGESTRTPVGLNRDKVLLETVSYLGTPYAYGENTKEGIDCSGFTSQVYRKAAQLRLPRSAREQYRTGHQVERDSLLFGDLVFFNTTGSGPSHVGIYIEDDLFAHASVSYGVTISSLQSSYYRERYFGARRVAGE